MRSWTLGAHGSIAKYLTALMSTTDPIRKLRVFLCHSSQDKPIVRGLYQRLLTVPQGDDKGWIDPWLDEERLFPSQDWDREIKKTVETIYGK